MVGLSSLTQCTKLIESNVKPKDNYKDLDAAYPVAGIKLQVK